MKLRMKLEDLEIETFATTRDGAGEAGTVRGMDATQSPCVPGQTIPQEGCKYPTTSCGDTETFGENTCMCLYPPTDPHLCCDGGSAPGSMC
jgi:hypothetical protein